MLKNRRISLLKLSRTFFMLIIAFLCFCVGYLFYLAYQADYEYVLTMAKQDNLRHLKSIESGVEKRMAEIARQLTDKCTFSSAAEVLDYQRNDRRFNEEINRQYLTSSEFLRFKNQNEKVLQEGAGAVEWPLRLHVFTLSSWAYRDTVKYLDRAFSCTGDSVKLDDAVVVREQYPVLMELCEKGVKIIPDDHRRVFWISQTDFQTAKNILQKNPDYVRQLEVLFAFIFRMTSVNFIWTEPSDIDTERSLCFYRFCEQEFAARGHLLWSVLFAFRASGRLVELVEPMMDLVRQGFALNLSIDKCRKEPYPLNKRILLWDLWPANYLFTDHDDDNLLLFPQAVIAGEINNRLLLPSVIIQESQRFFSAPSELVIQSKGTNELKLMEYAVLRENNQYLSHHQSSFSEPSLTTSEEQLPSWFFVTERQVEQLGVPYHLEKTDIDQRRLLITTYRSSSLEDIKLYFCQPVTKFFNPFYRRWFFLLCLLMSCVWFYRHRIMSCLSNLEQAVNSCLFAILHEQGKIYTGVAQNEILSLQQQLGFFHQQILRKFNFFSLTRRLYNILGIPRQNFRHYFDEFYYLAADISDDYRWQLLDSNLEHNAGFVAKLTLSDVELSYLRQKLSLQGYPQLRFHQELPAQELQAFQSFFSLLVQKASLEEGLAVTEQLRADRNLGVELQRYITPSATDMELSGLKVDFRLQRSNNMNYDFGGVWNNGQELVIYLVDLWENGLKAALIANTIKPYVDSLLVDSEPDIIVNRVNEFFCTGYFKNLFAGMICLKINSDGEFRVTVAGYPPLFHYKAYEQRVFTATSVPLGLAMRHQFTATQGRLEPLDHLIIMSDALFYQLYPQFYLSEVVRQQNTAGFSTVSDQDYLCSGVTNFTDLPARITTIMTENTHHLDDLLFLSVTKLLESQEFSS